MDTFQRLVLGVFPVFTGHAAHSGVAHRLAKIHTIIGAAATVSERPTLPFRVGGRHSAVKGAFLLNWLGRRRGRIMVYCAISTVKPCPPPCPWCHWTGYAKLSLPVYETHRGSCCNRFQFCAPGIFCPTPTGSGGQSREGPRGCVSRCRGCGTRPAAGPCREWCLCLGQTGPQGSNIAKCRSAAPAA